MSLPYLLIGSSGQLGQAFCALLKNQLFIPSREEMDLASPDKVKKALEAISVPFRGIIMTAAYTAVELAESEVEKAFTVNQISVAIIAEYAAKHSLPFIYYSTDYVFDGTENRPYTESDLTNPLNIYGKTKEKAEKMLLAQGAHNTILRLSGVFSPKGRNFINAIYAKSLQGDVIKVVNDQFINISYAHDIAEATLKLLEQREKKDISGIFHMTNQGNTSWFDVASFLLEEAIKLGALCKTHSVLPVLLRDFPTKAIRPVYSCLDNTKLASYGITLPSWQSSLKDCIKIMIIVSL